MEKINTLIGKMKPEIWNTNNILDIPLIENNINACERENACRNGFLLDCNEREKPLYQAYCNVLKKIWKEKLNKANIGERYFGDCTPNKVVIDNTPFHLKEQIKLVCDYRDNINNNLKEGIGLILMGPVGTMKTTAAISILMESLSRNLGGYFIVSASLLDDIFTLKATSFEDWVAFERRIRETSLLVWDDLGAEHPEGWVQTKVDAIISERYNRKRATIITTNLNSVNIKGRYAERVIDRLRGTCSIITFTGKSLRQSI